MIKVLIFGIAVGALIFIVATTIQLHTKNVLIHKKIDSLIAKEKYLKLVLTNNKYSGYLAIKTHYERKLMAYVKKHRNNKLALALEKKEEAEINYYKAK